MGTVLGVDDREDNLDLLRIFIVDRGHEFVGVSNPKDALARVRETQPDLIFMDLALPVVGGLELTSIIKADIDPNIPIVAITAVPEQYSEQQAQAAGCDAYISKPFTFAEIRTVLEQFISD